MKNCLVFVLTLPNTDSLVRERKSFEMGNEIQKIGTRFYSTKYLSLIPDKINF